MAHLLRVDVLADWREVGIARGVIGRDTTAGFARDWSGRRTSTAGPDRVDRRGNRPGPPRRARLLNGDAVGNAPVAPVESPPPHRAGRSATAAESEPVDAATVEDLPEVLVLLAAVITEGETGTVATVDLAHRTDWDPKQLGEAL
ncbi:hypothetical protein [Saccharothrix obliqua]|uniref:hypothetical protein n=1 Tax=Saccharothrix obliqua TaxID=2861747 RepID=UPI001C5DB255|nr:hypothetical protein [Saccharothrix obliqua]MBW4719802.1 hypothetical protein [Saccharothrix obliqua]